MVQVVEKRSDAVKGRVLVVQESRDKRLEIFSCARDDGSRRCHFRPEIARRAQSGMADN